jgi:short-subunit dehydrogenase
MWPRRRGKILLVSSLLAYQGVQNFAVYSAAKAYVLRLGEALHREFKRDGITMTTLCPGLSDTGFAQVANMTLTGAEADDDEARSGGPHRDQGASCRAHERRPRVT